MSSEKSVSNRSDDNEEDDELILLRKAALESMHKNKDNVHNSSNNNNNNNKVNDNSDHKRRTNINNYYPRNGSKRSNLIVLTAPEPEFVQTNSLNNRRETPFTRLIDKPSNDSSELSTKRKRVLPGRFSRLEKDEDSDEESDEYSDDNEDTNNSNTDKLSAFKASDRELLWPESDNTTTDVMSDTDQNLTKNVLSQQIEKSIDSNSSDCTNNLNTNDCSFNSIDSNNQNTNNDENLGNSLCFASTSTEPVNDCTKLDSETKKDTIKLTKTNNISGLDILEKRKQKFGDLAADEITDLDNNSVESFESSNNQNNNTNNKLSIKQRLSTNCVQNEKKSYVKNCRHRNNISNQFSINGVEKSFKLNTKLNRQLDSEEFDDNDSHSTKKKLRSLVVMKTE